MNKSKSIKAIILCLLSIPILHSCKKERIVEKPVYQNPEVETLVIGATHDATIKSQTTTNTTDQFDSSFASGVGDALAVGVSDDVEVKFRTLVQFDLSNLPGNAKITDARLQFTLLKSGFQTETIYVHKITEDWEKGSWDDEVDIPEWDFNAYHICSNITIANEKAVTWKYSQYSTLKEWDIAGGSVMNNASDSSSSKFSNNLSFNSEGLITDINNWRNNPSSNFGWMLKYKEENTIKDGGRLIRYYSAEGGKGKGGKPKLIINYYLE